MRGVLALGALALQAQVEPARLNLRLEAPGELHAGDRALLPMVVELPVHAARTLLITPSSEGDAVEVVRGRLLRSDARDPEAAPLRFDLPIVARAPGTSIVRVHALAYACEEQCTAVEAETRLSLMVLAR